MFLSDAHVRLTENRPGDFRRGPEREEHGREPSTEGMPTVPSVADRRLDHAPTEVIEMERSPHFLASKNPIAVPGRPPMGVEDLA